MAKKFLTCCFVAIILFLSASFCYAAEDENTSNKSDLGSELTESMNKVKESANDVGDNVKDKASGTITDNKITQDYNATRTAIDTNGTTNMNGTTWMWIILAVVGIVILATVWFYAMQNTKND